MKEEHMHEEKPRTIEDLISDFCKIVLTKKDSISEQEAKKYIDSLTSDERSILNSTKNDDDQIYRSIVQMKILRYIQEFQTSGEEPKLYQTSPFEFDNSGHYVNFQKNFLKTYKDKYENSPLPHVFIFIFEYIQNTSDYYRTFEQFYTIRSHDTTESLLNQTKNLMAEEIKKGIEDSTKEAAQEAATEAAQKAATEAKLLAEQAAQNAEFAAEQAKVAAESAVERAVKDKMTDVSSKISETSVTILGIFSSIVLTVVAGLMYSSSVLQSISTANFFRLVCISLIVGFICFHLISTMFRFIEKIKGIKHEKTSAKELIFNIIIVIAIIITAILQFIYPENTNQIENEERSANSISTETSLPETVLMPPDTLDDSI